MTDLTPLTGSTANIIEWLPWTIGKEFYAMASKRFTAEQIIPKLRTVEVEFSNGATVAKACKKIQVTEQTYYR